MRCRACCAADAAGLWILGLLVQMYLVAKFARAQFHFCVLYFALLQITKKNTLALPAHGYITSRNDEVESGS